VDSGRELPYVNRVMAERRAGELVKELQDAGKLDAGGRPPRNGKTTNGVLEVLKIADLGLTHQQSYRFQGQAILSERGVGRRVIEQDTETVT
jgi:hypothetical protein